MDTVEKLGWIALVLVLLVAVANVIIEPIYSKAKDQQREIDSLDFEDPADASSIQKIDHHLAKMGVSIYGDTREA
ncbi:hypothetical protein [Clostridiisalibacter paucivorans]|uniref:hypothetical protein n=1 Tax=Clostridiisalibacter paucivorans TaxID=408753 RepID=UPI00047D9FAB|nr:hypothetical protein [Clostridiisalibacter paucivorans]